MSTTVNASVDVNVPVHRAYDQWTQFEEFPQFMEAVRHVEQLDDVRTRWDTEIGGVKRTFEATTTEQIPDSLIRWESSGEKVHSGQVAFTSGPVGTRVDLTLTWKPEGFLERVGSTLALDEHAAERDLHRFKEFIENRGTATGAWRGTVNGETTPPEGESYNDLA
ncbi:Polyketide cyclase / dehydrase and lipid transport [Microbacterium azadirachtae]|uniref:Polyketide cyclase / dehydrase and lipid transport n=1 Tax=Microbacterium azadirachtae TaxID=582680 RepID=A0A0F0KXS6_9MICO|nr:SRPBCC family protein [Microbacterium azadirachtae]KJL24900.1 Polyketide cyclase / dehydrase and lipid transport [Microbacterium azadirachtae]